MTDPYPWPRCVGTHEPAHPQCDGDSSGVTAKDRAPCLWRDRCGGFKAHLNNLGTTLEEYGHPMKDMASEDAFVEACDEWAQQYGIAGGVPDGEQTGRKSLGHRRTSSSAWRKMRERGDDAVDFFLECLMQAFPDRCPIPGALVTQGKFLVADRRARSRYLAVYCMRGGARRVPVVTARPKAKSGGDVEIRLPITPGQWMARPASNNFVAVAVNDGAFRCSLGSLGRRELKSLARAMQEMEAAGELRLPKIVE